MMRLASRAGAAGLWLLVSMGALATATPVLSQPAATATAADTFNKDQAIVEDAMQSLNHSGYRDIARHVPDLRQVLDHAPTPDQARQLVGGDEARALGVRRVYSRAALILGEYDNEIGKFDEAEAYLDRGLAIDPADAALITEKGAALVARHRWDEALAVYTAGLGQHELSPTDQARMLRGQGFALTELKRYDDAEAAYKKSLELEPGHGGAQQELLYIARMRQGAAPEEGGLITVDKSRKRKN